MASIFISYRRSDTEADTGRLRWESRIDQLSESEELAGLFPHGSPVIGEGLVYALARKISGVTDVKSTLQIQP